VALNNAQATNNNRESGYVVFDRVNKNYTYAEGSSFVPEIIWGNIIVPGTKIDGLLHCHYNGLNNIFSPRDLLTMAEYYMNGYVKDSSNFFFGITSHSDAPYLIKISNKAKFQLFAQKIIAMEASNEGFSNAYNIKLNSGNNTKNLTEFFQMLQDLGGLPGLSVYEAVPDNNSNYNFDQWKKLNWDGNGGFNPPTDCTE
jgi:hypothetical protein